MVGELKVRVRVGEYEVEFQVGVGDVAAALDVVRGLLKMLPQPSYGFEGAETPQPTVRVEEGDSLADVILKIFSDRWGRRPRRLGEVCEALASQGLMHPKQSVAVALLRLAQAGKLRRFKERGEYVYVTATPKVDEGEKVLEGKQHQST
jgi:hypothetical protein